MASRWTAMYFLFGFVGFVSLYVFCFIRSILYRSLRAYCRKCCGHEDDDVELYVKLQEQIAQDKQNTSKSRRNHQVPQGAQQLIWWVKLQVASLFLRCKHSIKFASKWLQMLLFRLIRKPLQQKLNLYGNLKKGSHLAGRQVCCKQFPQNCNAIFKFCTVGLTCRLCNLFKYFILCFFHS